MACLSCASNSTIWGRASFRAGLRVKGGLIRNMPLAGKPGRLVSPTAFSVILLDFTVSVACSQLLPALHFYTMNQSAATLEICRRLEL